MTIDLRQFYEIFFEESREHIDELESLVLAVDCANPDPESIQTIFRSAHSLKGESAALDFPEITYFTHELETLLDQIRSGKKYFTPERVNLVMQSVDAIRSMVDGREANSPLAIDAFGTLVELIVVQAAMPEETEPPQAASESTADRKAVEAKPAAREHGMELESSIRVPVGKIDGLMNLVGELVITQGMLAQLRDRPHLQGEEFLMRGLDHLEHHTRDLQDRIMRIRMFPLRLVFERFPRLIHDLSRTLGKQVELVTQGEATELDKTVIEKIGDPMIHLIRNSVDHGVELPEERKAAGKPARATVSISAWQERGRVFIEISDDGCGLDGEKILRKAVEQELVESNARLSHDEICELIFKPGFSTAAEVSDISGRGVGMDVVRRNIEELHGSLHVRSEAGKGSSFRIDLPLTLAILDGQMVHVGEERYVIPLMSIIESIQVLDGEVRKLAAGCPVYDLRGEYIPVVELRQVFHVHGVSQPGHSLMVVVENDSERVGILVDALGIQQQVVSKSIEENFVQIEGVGGATICGDGSVALILDIPGLIGLAGVNRAGREKRQLRSGRPDG